ncbi:MAG TPA: hypothetical protein VFA33_17015 [Bryobacteraceae bacterium]|nr:hypothetical protein [Bryobacteraceae bacterium]
MPAGVLEAIFLRLRWYGDLREHVVETIAALLLGGAFYLVSCHFSIKHSHGTKSFAGGGDRLRAAGWILAAGILFRLTVWPLPPSLSDDPYRYRWEGELQAAGGNPYQARPADAAWAALRDSAFPRVVGKDFKAVYGPLVEQAELWTYRAVSARVTGPERQVFWFKLPFAACDIGVLAVLWFWLPSAGLPRERILLYAWSPLPVLEFWAAGHNDSLAVLLVAGAFLAARRHRWTWAFLWLSLAAAAKLWPALLLPLFLDWEGWRPRRWRQALIFLPVAGLLAWPYRSNVWENARFLSGFVSGWRNNDSFYSLVLWLAGDPYIAKKIAGAIILGGMLAAAAWTARQSGALKRERAALALLLLTLMVSANCHPWYLTWILPLLAFLPVPALLLWSALVPLAYAAVIDWSILGEWRGSTWVRWYEYVPVFALLAGTWLLRKVRPRSHRSYDSSSC